MEHENRLVTYVPQKIRHILFFNLVSDGSRYYVISNYQSLLGSLFFVFYWLLPVCLLEIEKEEFDELVRKELPEAASSRKKSVNGRNSLGTILGLLLGRAIYSIIGDFHTGRQLALPVFILINLAAILLIYLCNVMMLSRLKKSLTDSSRKRRWIVIKPLTKTKNSIIGFLFMATILGFFTWFFASIYFKEGNIVSLLFLQTTLVTYTQQSKGAFIPGDYRFKEVKK